MLLCTSSALALSLLAFLIASRPAVLVSGISGTGRSASRLHGSIQIVESKYLVQAVYRVLVAGNLICCAHIYKLRDEIYLSWYGYAVELVISFTP